MNMGPFLFNTPVGEPQAMQQSLQRHADAYVQATRKSLEAVEGLMHEWVQNRRSDLEQTENVMRKIGGSNTVNEAFDIAQHWVTDRSRQIAEEAIQFPSKLGSISLHAIDIIRSAGVPFAIVPLLPAVLTPNQARQLSEQEAQQMARAEAGKQQRAEPQRSEQQQRGEQQKHAAA